MDERAQYRDQGYAFVEQLLAPEIAGAMLDRVWTDLRDGQLPIRFEPPGKVLSKTAMQLHGARHPPLTSFLWGLTPAISQLTGRELLPTYCFFRLYQKGDQLRFHADRAACEHSLSLTLGYSDGRPWPLEIERDGELVSFPMQPGDALLYRGADRRHGRTAPNPNQWSAHLFCHWVDADGPHRALAFEDLDLAEASSDP